MGAIDYNPFQAIDISIPVAFHDYFKTYCQTGNKSSIDHSPFPRMIDLWFFSFCVAAYLKLKPQESKKGETKKIIDGSIFSSDPWRVNAIMLAAISIFDDINVVSKPRQMLELANGLSVAGLPKVIEMLKNGYAEPIWNISDAMDNLIRKNGNIIL